MEVIEGRRRSKKEMIRSMESAEGVTVPCRRTPPFFRKRGLPDHSGGLKKKKDTGRKG